MLASNDNGAGKASGCPPYLELRPTGDVRVLARALARVIVRQELKFATAIDEHPDCDEERAA